MGSPTKPGVTFKTMRLAQGLTLERLAELAGVGASDLDDFERGQIDPDAHWALAVNQALADHARGDDAA